MPVIIAGKGAEVCYACKGVFGTVVKDGLCSHCKNEVELEESIDDSTEYNHEDKEI